MRSLKFDREVQEEIDLLGDRVRIVQGSRHLKLYVDGIFATIAPARPGASKRAALNIRASLRQAADGRTQRGGRMLTER